MILISRSLGSQIVLFSRKYGHSSRWYTTARLDGWLTSLIIFQFLSGECVVWAHTFISGQSAQPGPIDCNRWRVGRILEGCQVEGVDEQKEPSCGFKVQSHPSVST